MAGSKKRPEARRETSAKPTTDRVTYRELRNTPALVWDRLANDEVLTLVAGGEAKALMIPIPDGDAAAAQEAYRRGRALLAVRRVQDAARTSGKSDMSLNEIDELIRQTRRALSDREDSGA
jgi:serine/threonine-protein kinase RIO1